MFLFDFLANLLLQNKANTASVAIPHWFSAFLDIAIYPFIPQSNPHEFFTIQYSLVEFFPEYNWLVSYFLNTDEIVSDWQAVFWHHPKPLGSVHQSQPFSDTLKKQMNFDALVKSNVLHNFGVKKLTIQPYSGYFHNWQAPVSVLVAQ